MLTRLLLGSTLILLVTACQSSPLEDSKEQLIELYAGNAQLYYEGGHYRSALAQAAKVLELDPENQKALFVQAMSNLALRQPEGMQRARDQLEKLVQEDFGRRQFRVWLGVAMARAGVGDLYDARYRRLEQQIADSPMEAPELAPRRTEAKQKRDELWNGSIEAAQKVLSYVDEPLAKNDPIALYYIYRNLSLLGRPQEALVFEERHLSVIVASRKQWEKAVKEYPSAKEIYESKLRGARKNEMAIRETMAQTLNDLGRYEEAVTHLTNILQLDPSRARTFLNRAQLLRRLGRHAEAVIDLRKFIEKTDLGPDSPDAQEAVSMLRDSERRMMEESPAGR